MKEKYLVCEGLTKSFVDHRSRRVVTALRDANLSISRGEFVCLVGPSGCGKSTLVHLIAGIDMPDQGKIYINGKEAGSNGEPPGIVFQEYSLFPWMTVMENMRFGLELKGWPVREQYVIARKYLDLVRIQDFDEARPNELSGGMKQKVAIARALSLERELLLMDEPFSNLDEQTRRILDMELLRIWKETGKTVLFVTHNIEEAVILADRILLMTVRPGRVQEEFCVDLPRPRVYFDRDVSDLHREILEELKLCCNDGPGIS